MTPSPPQAPSPSGGRTGPWEWWPAAALAVLAGVVTLRAAIVVPISQLMLDDGFYYLRIAQHLAQGQGSTWDGLHPTNGYHPLWLLILVPLARLVRDPDSALVAVYLVESVLLTASVVLVYLACRRAAGRVAERWIASLAAVLWLGLTYRWFVSGMEYALQATLVLVVLVGYPHWRQRPLVLGGLLALAFLARLDTLLLAGVVAVLGLVDPPSTLSRTDWLARLSIPMVLVVALYAILNSLAFGHPLPVSGAVKGDWSSHLLQLDTTEGQRSWLVAKVINISWPASSFPDAWPLALLAGTLGIAIATGFAARWLPGGGLDRALRPLAPFTLFSLLSFLAYGVVYHGGWSRSPWYFAIQPILAAVLFAVLAAAVARWTPPRAVAILSALALLAAGARLFGGIGQSQPPADGTIQPVLAAIAKLPDDAVLASWNGGAMAYLSGRRIVALDGLVNSWAYARSHRHDLCRYWSTTGVTHLVDAFRFEDGRPTWPAFPGDPGFTRYAACRDRLHPVWTGEPRGALRMAILEFPR